MIPQVCQDVQKVHRIFQILSVLLHEAVLAHANSISLRSIDSTQTSKTSVLMAGCLNVLQHLLSIESNVELLDLSKSTSSLDIYRQASLWTAVSLTNVGDPIITIQALQVLIFWNLLRDIGL